MKIGSLFDGSGGFPLAGAMCGIEPRFASEIEPYPIAVTKSRFPNMKHLGSVTDIHGDKIEPVDIITFGSPCQDLSVAGKRAGLKHESNGDEETTRSGLFMEAVRIIKEMRRATNGVYPRFAVWENVPGAFSSHKGEDFRIVLEELIKIAEPAAVMPSVPKGGWPYADSYCGDGWSIAYRTFDAQYWGVAQRRRRIYLVADFTGQCAGEILFEREGLRGHFETGRTPWQGTACHAESRALADDREGWIAAGFKAGQSMAGGIGWQEECAATLSAQASGTEPTVCKDTNGPQCDGINEDICFTMNTIDLHAVAYGISSFESNAMKSSNPHSGIYEATTSRTIDLNGGNPACNQGGIAIVESHATDIGFFNSMKEQAPSLLARGFKDPHMITEIRYIVRRITPTECARLQGFPDQWGHIPQKDNLTDEEYTFWLNVRNTHAAVNGKATKEYTQKQMLTWYNKLHTDSAEYKMWGNGIALPNALYVMQGIKEALTYA